MKKKALLFIALAFTLLLSACSQSSSSDDTNNKKNSGKLEIFSWWTGAGEEDGLKALIKLFKEKNPDIPVENAAVAGGAGTNAKAVLASRMQGNDPPATFQVHGGAELNDGWVAADKMEPLNDLYDKEKWNDKFPKQLIDMVSKDGKIYSVPVDIHRGNVLWYNKKVFADNNLQAPKTLDEFFKVADKLKAKGITPLALGDKEPWTATMIFENILLGTLGNEDYQKLWTGDLKFDDPKVKKAAESFKKMLSYVNDDHSSRNWQDASQLVAKGDAAMNIMGDWAKGYFVNDLKLKVNEDFGWVATPGSEGQFMIITDTFGLPKGVKNTKDVKQFLSLLGSVEGQDAFNPLKGSIPARTDADESKYDEYGKQTMKEFKEAKLAPSLAHGSAAPEGFVTKANQAVNIFVTQKNVGQLIDSLNQASSELKK
ncbi:ABC transporter substrate-binding protein [Fictibacillus fluitans]|uniref:Probable sugar-binding periplasmic protein n=1 Tax=Fictibacillus fluitans TaxID=3058422 RepID=A0ABT8HQS8_9BACL|nr:ABC transporter substrate-binding protein [Fictibacillus sp. NE201]MDN4523122.1 ABC transporter substrate-binding protein [Fictibacillus sp. NE201]